MPTQPPPAPSSPALDLADDIVAFFRGLPASAHREYAALAELDREFGEDVEREMREKRANDDGRPGGGGGGLP